MSTYWWREPAEDLVRKLKRKRREFLDVLDSTGLYSRIHESWCLYHGVRSDGLGDSIRIAGAEGELRVVSLNEFRSSLSLLRSYITSNRVEWDTIATSGDAKALTAAKKGNQILDAAIEDTRTGVEQCLSQAVEDALILTAGFLFLLWDPTTGKEESADVNTGAIYRAGEIRCTNPCLFDVVYDWHVRDFRESRWVDVRRQENKWDLIAENPELEDELDRIRVTDASDRYDFNLDTIRSENDFVWVHYAYHKPSPALPNGRYLRYVEDLVIEARNELPDGHVPLYRYVPAQFMLTPFGFTPAFSCQAPQRLLDAVVSTIATNAEALGSSKVWKKPGEPINRGTLENGITVIECETKPEVLNFLQTSPELFKEIELYQGFVRSFSAANDAAHGQPQASLKSGAALAFTEQRVQQAASDMVIAWDNFLSDAGTGYLDVIRKRSRSQRQLTVTKSRKRQFESYSAEDLAGIDRVSVVRGNPLMRTRGQRVQIAEFLLERQIVTPEEFLTVILTGSLEKLVERADNQLDIVHQENERMLGGDKHHVILPTDNHILHVRLHVAAADAISRYGGDPEINKALYSAAQQHKDRMQDPEVAMWQALLGYGPPAAPPGPMAPPGGPGAEGPEPAMEAGGELPMPEGAGPEGGGPRLLGAPEEMAQVA